MTTSYIDNHSSIKASRIRPLPAAFFKNAADMTFPDIAYVVIDVLLGDELAHGTIKQLINTAYPPSRPIVDGAFLAALIRCLSPAATPVVFALSSADAALAKALASSGKTIVFCSRSHLVKLPDSATTIEIQGSDAECEKLLEELSLQTTVFTADCAVSAAVNAAKAIYLATRPGANLTGLPEPMSGSFNIAFAMGLPKVDYTVVPSQSASINHNRITRIPPKLDSALRLINASTKVNKKLK